MDNAICEYDKSVSEMAKKRGKMTISKEKDYRIVTNGRGRFRVQKLKKFWWLKWWGSSFTDSGFFRTWDAEHALEEHLASEKLQEHSDLTYKEGQKGPWKPVGEEN